MTAPNEISEIVVQFRARLAANRHLAALLSRSVRDCRVKRILALLEEIAPHGEVIPPSAQEILKICDDDPVRYRGFHPRLAFLKENLSKATDFLAELSKRMLLYLKHIEVQGSSLSPSIRRLAQSAITEQKEMAVKLCQSACGAINIALSKPPGPAPMPYDDHRSEPTALSKSSRRLRGGKPSSIGHDYDSRWDPDYKMPGSQHGKFLTFAGPFFASHKDEAGNFDHFCLSANHGAHIESWKFKYEVVTTNFTDTGRLRTRNDEDMDRLRARQKVICSTKTMIPLLTLLRILESCCQRTLAKYTIPIPS